MLTRYIDFVMSEKRFLTFGVCVHLLSCFGFICTSYAQSALPALSGSLRDKVSQYQASLGEEASVHMSIQLAEQGSLVFEENNQAALELEELPPHVLSYALLKHLGSNYRFPTEVFVSGSTKSSDFSVSGGVIPQVESQGLNVYIRFYGDPTFDLKSVESVVRGLSERGIVEINDVYLDRTLFEDPKALSSAEPKGAALDPLVLEENAYEIKVLPRGKFADFMVPPSIQISDASKVSMRRFSGEPLSVQQVPDWSSYIGVLPKSTGVISERFEVTILGILKKNSTAERIRFSHPDIPSYFAASFKKYAEELDVKIAGSIKLGPVSSGARLSFVHESDALRSILHRIYTSPFYRKQMMYFLGQSESKYGKMSRASGEKKLYETILEATEKSEGALELESISTDHLSSVLVSAYRNFSIAPAFLASVPSYPVISDEDSFSSGDPSSSHSLKVSRFEIGPSNESLLDSLYLSTMESGADTSEKSTSHRVLSGYLTTYLGSRLCVTLVTKGKFEKADAIAFEHDMIRAILGLNTK